MDREEVSALIKEALIGYRYAQPLTGGTVGIPWSAGTIQNYVEKLKAALVEPYLQRFELRETYEQVSQRVPRFAEYWMVAECDTYLVWFDPTTGEFGLGQRSQEPAHPISIGVRGDLVGVF